jgi:hypothetical protein
LLQDKAAALVECALKHALIGDVNATKEYLFQAQDIARKCLGVENIVEMRETIWFYIFQTSQNSKEDLTNAATSKYFKEEAEIMKNLAQNLEKKRD